MARSDPCALLEILGEGRPYVMERMTALMMSSPAHPLQMPSSICLARLANVNLSIALTFPLGPGF